MKYPNEDCEYCFGEGVDADPYGLFDGDFRKACPHCWDNTEEDEE